MKILIVVDMQKDFISGPLGTAEARAIVPYVAEKAKNTPRENLFVTLDTHQPNYMETNEGRHLPVPHCIEGTEGHALDVYKRQGQLRPDGLPPACPRIHAGTKKRLLPPV